MWSLLLLAVVVTARDVSDEDYAKFPRLYHLDDHERCLAHVEGLYCVGTFSIAPLKEPHPMFDLIKEYSEDPHNFNRSEVHRGYCVSSRCPQLKSERNASLRYERCAALWARRRSLRVTLSKFHYCRSHAQEYARTHNPEPFELSEKLLLFAIMVLVLLNTIGTTYDMLFEDNIKKNRYLLVWSVRRNWHRLTASYDDGEQRLCALSPIQGLRVLLMAVIMAVHSGCIYDMLYLNNPRWVEQVSRHPVLMLFLNGTSAVQLFVTLSSFLLAYNLLLFSKNNVLTLKMLPLIIIKRLARISPLYVLAVASAATLWPRAGAGPMWPLAVEAEGHVCRHKFWTHALYINNFINPNSICLVQTWFLAVDMQLYLVAAVLCLTLAHLRRRALPILATLVVTSAVLNGALAYLYKWQSLVYYSYPQPLSTMYSKVPSFSRYYQSPWASLPGCLVGLFSAFLHFELHEAGVKLSSYKCLKLPYNIAPLAMVCWIMSGVYLRQYKEDWVVATYVAVERPVPSILWAIMIIGMVNGMEGWLKQVMSWRGWQPLARMSLAVLLVHWCINMSIAASRPGPLTASLLNVAMDFMATSCFSYILAVPLTIMVEMPLQKCINALLFEIQSPVVTPGSEDTTNHRKRQ